MKKVYRIVLLAGRHGLLLDVTGDGVRDSSSLAKATFVRRNGRGKVTCQFLDTGKRSGQLRSSVRTIRKW